MSDFINTVDIVDDDVLMDSLIDRSISGSFNDDKITKIGSSAFSGCTNLESVSFPNVTKIGLGAFAGSGLKAITPETFPSVTQIDYAYSNGIFQNSALESVEWPSLIYVGNTTIFNNCKSLKRISLPNYVNNANYLGTLTMKNCTSLTDVYLPVAIQCPDFGGCTSLETITLPKITLINYNYAFSGCTSLKTVDLPACTAIGTSRGVNIFENCTAIMAFILRSTEMCVYDIYENNQNYDPFKNTGISNGTGYIYVPRALLSDDDETSDYRRATNWSTYAAQFRALEDYTVDGTITGELDETKI